MISDVLAIFYVVFLIAAILSMGFALYHLFMTITNIRGDKKILSNVFAPFVLLMPNVFTDSGNYHRKRFGLFIIVCVVNIVICAVIDYHL